MGKPEQLDSKIYSMYKNISLMSVKKIERLREKVQAEIESEKEHFISTDNAHEFVEILMNTCIEAAKRKSHQDGPYEEPDLVAEVTESLPQQDDPISFAV